MTVIWSPDGVFRRVEYENESDLEAAKAVVRADLESSANDSRVKSALLNADLKERYDRLLALAPA